MNNEQRLYRVAKRYQSLGFKVAVRPEPEQLPDFAKDFKVELVATKDDGNVLVVAKNSPSELEADPNVQKYADITTRQSGWRFDILVLGPDQENAPKKADIKDLQDVEIRRYLDDVGRMVQAGFVSQSVAVAWAALEAAMRIRLRAQGEEAGWGTNPRTMLNELFSAGVFNNSVFRDLEGVFELRNRVVHGFSTPDVQPRTVEFLTDTTRRLLDEAVPVKQPA